MAKVQFSSRLGVIAATVGSAVGLGNIWRFPAEAQANGGSAFLLVYIGCVFLLGIPVMLAEFTLGRGARTDAVGAFRRFGGRRWWSAVGFVGLLASYLILWFYMVVAGWTLEYLVESVTGNLYSGEGPLNARFVERMHQYISSQMAPLWSTYLMIAINLGVLLMGVRKGIERMSNIMMPLLFVILLILLGVAIALPGAGSGIEFFLKPDFSKVNVMTGINALGQAFFSLSLGMGILITYASYFPKSARLTRTATIVSLLDMLVAVVTGVIIFASVSAFNLGGESLAGTTLVFVTLPEVFAQMQGGLVWSSLFFLLLTVAALTSTISLAEVSVKYLEDHWNMRRRSACLAAILPLFITSTVCSLSLSEGSALNIMGMPIFDFLNDFTSNIMLPVVAFLSCIYVGWVVPRRLLTDQLTNNGVLRSRVEWTVMFIIRFVAPPLIIIVLLSPLF